MKPKKIAFFSALLLLLLGFYYFYEIQWTARQKEKAEASKKVLNGSVLFATSYFIVSIMQ